MFFSERLGLVSAAEFDLLLEGMLLQMHFDTEDEATELFELNLQIKFSYNTSPRSLYEYCSIKILSVKDIKVDLKRSKTDMLKHGSELFVPLVVERRVLWRHDGGAVGEHRALVVSAAVDLVERGVCASYK